MPFGVPLGLAFGLGAALMWGLTDVVATFAGRRIGSLRVVVGSHLLEMVVLGVLSPPCWARASRPTPESAVSAVLVGCAGTFAYLSFFTALRIGPLSVVSPITAAYGGLTVILAVVFRGEALSPQQALGAAVATGGVVLAGLVFDGGLRSARIAGAGVLVAVGGAARVLGDDGRERGSDPRDRLAAGPDRVADREHDRCVAGAARGRAAGRGRVGWRRCLEAPTPARRRGWALAVAAGLFDVVGLVSFAIGLERAETWLVGLASSFGPAVAVLVGVAVMGERLRRDAVAGARDPRARPWGGGARVGEWSRTVPADPRGGSTNAPADDPPANQRVKRGRNPTNRPRRAAPSTVDPPSGSRGLTGAPGRPPRRAPGPGGGSPRGIPGLKDSNRCSIVSRPMATLSPDVTAALATLEARWGAAAPRPVGRRRRRRGGRLARDGAPSERAGARPGSPARRGHRVDRLRRRSTRSSGPAACRARRASRSAATGRAARRRSPSGSRRRPRRTGSIVAWLDVGRSFDPVEAVARGVRLPWLVVVTPADLDEGLSIAGALLGGRAVDLLVIDLPARLGRSPKPAKVADRLHRLAALARRADILLVLLEPPGGGPSALGTAVAESAGLRLELARRAWIRLGRDVVGQRTEVVVARNRFGPPGRRVGLRILYADGDERDACLPRDDLLVETLVDTTNAPIPVPGKVRDATPPPAVATSPPRSRAGPPALRVVPDGARRPRRPAVDGRDRPRREPGGPRARRAAGDPARDGAPARA